MTAEIVKMLNTMATVTEINTQDASALPQIEAEKKYTDSENYHLSAISLSKKMCRIQNTISWDFVL